MIKVSLEEVESKLLEKKIEPKKVAEIIRELEEVVEEIKQEEKKEQLDEDGLPVDVGADGSDKVKWEYVIILADKEGYLKDKEIAGWVVQQAENDDAGTILTRLMDAAKDQNESAKKKKNTITDFVGLFESLKPKFLKSKKVRIKTKDLTRVLVTDGKFLSSMSVGSNGTPDTADEGFSNEDIENVR